MVLRAYIVILSSSAPNEGRNNWCHLNFDFETFRDFFRLRDQKTGSASALVCTLVKGASDYPILLIYSRIA